MQVRNYGLIRAEIDDEDQRITLSFSERGKQPLDDGHPLRCLSWALAALMEYTDRGYVITVPEAVPGG